MLTLDDAIAQGILTKDTCNIVDTEFTSQQAGYTFIPTSISLSSTLMPADIFGKYCWRYPSDELIRQLRIQGNGEFPYNGVEMCWEKCRADKNAVKRVYKRFGRRFFVDPKWNEIESTFEDDIFYELISFFNRRREITLKLKPNKNESTTISVSVGYLDLGEMSHLIWKEGIKNSYLNSIR